MLDTTNIFTEYPDIVTTNQMSTMLNIGKNKVYELLNNNEIESIKLGKYRKKALHTQNKYYFIFKQKKYQKLIYKYRLLWYNILVLIAGG